MRPRLFFLADKLNITPGERRALVPLLAILMISGVLNVSLSRTSPYDGEYYEELDQKFQQRIAQLEKEEQELMQRYSPDEFLPARVDTLPEDSAKTDSADTGREGETQSDEQRVNINIAGRMELETLPGIGPVYARRIVEYRKENNGFNSVEELMEIKGIGEKRLDNLKPFVKLKDSN